MTYHDRTRPSLALVASLLPLALLTACPADDAPADTEATAGSSTGESSTGVSSLDTTAASESSSSSSTTAPPDESTSSSSGADSTTGEPPLDGFCEGFELVGNIATVLSRDGMPIDTTCDPTPMPCGGDPVGSWTVESTCGFESFPNPLEDACPGSTFVLEVLGQSGTITFETDGSFVQDFDIQSQVVVTLDTMACFGVDCATFEMVAQGDNPGATCQEMGPTCECTVPDDGMPEQAMGTWEVMGNTLVLTTAEGDDGSEFCIAGDRLDLWQPLFDSTLTDVPCTDDQQCFDELGDMYAFYSCTPPE